MPRGVWACLWAPGGCPGATTSDVWALGGASYFGPGWVQALLVACGFVGGMCCVVLRLMGPGRMHVQWPGWWVAGCGSCRRNRLVAVLWCYWPALGGLRLLACACAFEDFCL